MRSGSPIEGVFSIFNAIYGQFPDAKNTGFSRSPAQLKSSKFRSFEVKAKDYITRDQAHSRKR